ncbi:MAG: inorganic phosphate transporter [Ruminococcaceae bacterium]|nr:inorganic phosphate transporter [Oscillospiraceae bacterium]
MTVLFTVLILLVILVNGWTDAPNAIAGCVSTHSLSPTQALLLAAICNFVGAVGMAFLNPGVAITLFGIADFGSDEGAALSALCAGLCAVILWATVAHHFGIPTSESHALISGITGAALAQRMSGDAINAEEWHSVLLGLFATTLPALLLGAVFYKLLLGFLGNRSRRRVMQYFRRTQCISAAGSALLHGAQDSQKFMGVYLLGLSFVHREIDGTRLPLFVVLSCAAVMTLGTMLGGAKIIKKVGCDMTDLDAAGGSASDAASTAILAVCSLLGLPASTTHSKACAIMGTGLCKRGGIDLRIAGQMLAAWALTFPLCGAIGFFLSFLIGRL